MKRFTIKNIAELAGVSTTTVSFVLNNKEGVSEETRKKIIEIIKSTNYIPSATSRNLKLRKSFNINIALKNTASPFNNLFYMDLTRGILSCSKKYCYNIVFSHVEDDITSSSLYQSMVQKNTDGVIFLQDVDDHVLEHVRRYELPYILVDSHSIDNRHIVVKGDYELSSYCGTKYLIDRGHKKIGFIGYGEIPNFFTASFNGFKRAIAEKNLRFRPEWIQSDASDSQTAYSCMALILKSENLPTAVFCAGDAFAIGAMQCIKAHGLHIPGDISLFGIDDIPLSQYVEPRLTTIRIDAEKMGSIAMEMIVKLINNQPCNSYTIESDNIVERESVKTL